MKQAILLKDARGRRAFFDALVHALYLGGALVLIWACRFPPLEDYPDWLYQGHLFTRWMRGTLPPEYRLVPACVPNALSTLVIGTLSLVLPPEVAGKVFLSLAVLGFALGSAYLLRSLDAEGHSPLRFIPLLYILGRPFWVGNINYVASLGALFYGMGYVLRHREGVRRGDLWVIAALSLLLYTAHAISFGIWLLFLCFAVRVGGLRVRWVGLFCALLPTLVMAGDYLAYRLVSAHDVRVLPGQFGWLELRLHCLFGYLSIFDGWWPYFREPRGVLQAMGWVNVGASTLLVALAIQWLIVRPHGDAMGKALQATAWVLILLFLTIPERFAGIWCPGERFIYPACWIALVLGAAPFRARPDPRVTWGAIAALLLFWGGEVAWSYVPAYRASRAAEKTYHELAALRQLPNQAVLPVDMFDYGGAPRLPDAPPEYVPRTHPLIRLPYYLHLATGTPIEIYDTALFTYDGPQRWWGAMDALRTGRHLPRHLIALGSDGWGRYLAERLAGHYEEISRADHLRVLRRKGTAGR